MLPTEPLVLESGRSDLGDEELERLIHDVYVGGGFTDPHVAASAFVAAAIRARGTLLFVRDRGHLAGTVIVAGPESPARRFAGPGEAEMHLLAVAPACRRGGIGRALVAASIATAREAGHARMILWTQSTMHAAQRLYAGAGFSRTPQRDFTRDRREFWVYQRPL